MSSSNPAFKEGGDLSRLVSRKPGYHVPEIY